jgi:hypothetical protein
MKKTFFILMLLLIFSVNAQTANVIKNSPDSIKLNDILKVDISINNNYNIEKSYEVTEKIPRSFIPINPNKPDDVEKNDALSINLYKWRITIPSNKIVTLSYEVKPTELGEYTLSSTKVRELDTNTILLSDSKKLIVLCKPNNICDPGENSLNCYEDCGSGLADGICDYKSDGKCDPDCEDEPDCKKGSYKNYIYIFLGLIVLLIIIISLINIYKKIKNQSI